MERNLPQGSPAMLALDKNQRHLIQSQLTLKSSQHSKSKGSKPQMIELKDPKMIMAKRHMGKKRTWAKTILRADLQMHDKTWVKVNTVTRAKVRAFNPLLTKQLREVD